MEFTTIIGLVAVIFSLIFGIAFSGNGLNMALLQNFLDGPSVFIVVGGTAFALLIAFPLDSFKKVPKHMKMIFKKDKTNPFEYVEILTELSKEARRKGLLALEDKALAFEDKFLKESVLLIVDAIETEKLRDRLGQKLIYMDRRNADERRIYELGSALAPAFGMIGTLIGLVNMLKAMNLESGPEALGINMSVALITTFYGTVLANGFFVPVSNKLEIAQDKDMLLKEMVVEAVISIKEGENPRFIEEKLLNFLEHKEVKKKDKKEGAEDENKKASPKGKKE